MDNTADTIARRQGTPTGRLWWVGATAAAASVTANLAVRSTAFALLDIPREFVPLASAGQIIVFTVLGVLGAVIVFAIVGRLARSPLRTFRRIAVGSLLLSFVPDLWLLAARDRLPFPGTSVQSVGTLMAMHVLTAAIVVAMLTASVRPK